MIPLKYTYQKQDNNHIFKTEILGFKIERIFTKESFENVGDKDLSRLMLKAFKTYVNTCFRDGLVLSLDKEIIDKR